jgi:hypothetical protein
VGISSTFFDRSENDLVESPTARRGDQASLEEFPGRSKGSNDGGVVVDPVDISCVEIFPPRYSKLPKDLSGYSADEDREPIRLGV